VRRTSATKAIHGRNLQQIAFPLGGVAAGSISLGGADNCVTGRFSTARIRGTRRSTPLRLSGRRRLEGRRWSGCWKRGSRPYEGASGLGHRNAPGLPRLSRRFSRANSDRRDRIQRLGITGAREPRGIHAVHPPRGGRFGPAHRRVAIRAANPTSGPVQVSIAFSVENPGSEGGPTTIARRPLSTGYSCTTRFDGRDPRKGTSPCACSIGPGRGHLHTRMAREPGGGWAHCCGMTSPAMAASDRKLKFATRPARFASAASWHGGRRSSPSCWPGTSPTGHRNVVDGPPPKGKNER
jgi:hypothetical protein